MSNAEMFGTVAKDNETVIVMPQGAMCWNSFDPLRGTGTNTNKGFTETFFKKIVERVTTPLTDELRGKYNIEFVSEEEEAYEWPYKSSEYEGENELYKTTDCYKWLDAENKW